MANPAIIVDFVANTGDLAAGFRKAQGHAEGFGGKLKSLAKGGALAAGAAGIGGLTAALKIGIDEFGDAQKVSAQTAATLKSTGGAANVTAKHVSTLSESLMKKSGVDDEAIASGENLLLTFTNIRNEAGKGNDVFDQTTKAALDMSTALGTDMKSAAMQLGKALNDPIKGVTKLQRSGVTFTESQKEMIKKLQESGDTLGAQKIILGEVNKEFGGSAAAAGKTLPGQLNILKESFNNLAGELVGKLVPVLQSTITWLRDHWPEISKAFADMWKVVEPVLSALWALLKAVVSIVVDNWPLISPIVQAVGTNIKNVMKVVGDVLRVVADILRGDWSKAWQDAKKLVSDVVATILGIIRGYLSVFSTVARALGRAILDGIVDGVTGLYGALRSYVSSVVNAVDDFIGTAGSKALSVGKAIYHGFIDGVTGLYGEIRDRVSGAVNAVDDFIGTAGSKALEVGRAIKNGVSNGISGIVGMVRDAISGALNAVIDVINRFHIPAIKVKGKTIFKGWGGMNIPHLAQGGIVTGPTLAMIGEAGPEAVVPLGAGGFGGDVHVRVFIGDRELTSLVRTEIVDANTGLARALLAG